MNRNWGRSGLAVMSVSLVVVVGACGGLGGGGLTSPKVAAMRRVLDKDVELERKMAQWAERDKVTPVVFCRRVLESQKQISLSGCPDDFARAYRANIAAFESALRVAEKYETVAPTMARWDALASLDPTRATTPAEREIPLAVQEIQATSDQYWGVASRYGIPRYSK